MVQRVKDTANIANFGAYAIILEKSIAQSFENVYKTMLTRLAAQKINGKFTYLKNDEVRFCFNCKKSGKSQKLVFINN